MIRLRHLRKKKSPTTCDLATRLLFDLPPFLSNGFLQSSLQFTQQFFRLELPVWYRLFRLFVTKRTWSRTKKGQQISTRNLL